MENRFSILLQKYQYRGHEMIFLIHLLRRGQLEGPGGKEEWIRDRDIPRLLLPELDDDGHISIKWNERPSTIRSLVGGKLIDARVRLRDKGKETLYVFASAILAHISAETQKPLPVKALTDVMWNDGAFVTWGRALPEDIQKENFSKVLLLALIALEERDIVTLGTYQGELLVETDFEAGTELPEKRKDDMLGRLFAATPVIPEDITAAIESQRTMAPDLLKEVAISGLCPFCDYELKFVVVDDIDEAESPTLDSIDDDELDEMALLEKELLIKRFVVHLSSHFSFSYLMKYPNLYVKITSDLIDYKDGFFVGKNIRFLGEIPRMPHFGSWSTGRQIDALTKAGAYFLRRFIVDESYIAHKRVQSASLKPVALYVMYRGLKILLSVFDANSTLYKKETYGFSTFEDSNELTETSFKPEQYLESQEYLLVRDIERALHRRSKEILQAEFSSGSNWELEGIPLQVRTKCSQRWEEDKRRAHNYNYTDLVDIARIAKANWSCFQEAHPFSKWKNSRKKMESELIKLNEIRKLVMHPIRFEMLSSSDREFLKDMHGFVCVSGNARQ